MQAFESFLQSRGFSKVDDLALMKITYTEYIFNDERNVVSQTKDLRFCVQNNKVIGLHISGLYNAIEYLWEVLKKDFANDLASVEVIYLARNNFLSFDTKGINWQKLTFLNLSQSPTLTNIKLSNLPHLQELYANRCEKLSSLTLEGKFNDLTKIDISFGQINELRLPKNLPSLQYFNFRKNKLSDISFLNFLARRKDFDLDYLFWQKNRLPETLLNTLKRRDYETLKSFFGIEEKNIRFYRKKLILLGNTQAGKTSLCDILLNKKLADGSSTHGVNIFRYVPQNQKEKEVLVQIFDFGGQDFYHNTHLAFYSQNANYLLVYGNRQVDGYGTIETKDLKRNDDIFPKTYWLDSVMYNLDVKTSEKTNLTKIYEDKNIKIGLLENLYDSKDAEAINQESLKNKYCASKFWHYSLYQNGASKLIEAQQIKDIIDDWLMDGILEDLLPERIKQLGDKIVVENDNNAILLIAELKDDKEEVLNEIELRLLHDSYYIHWKEDAEEVILKEYAIVNQHLFCKWIYAILNLENLFGKGYFSEKDAQSWLQAKGFDEDIAHLTYILAFLIEEKMIFRVEENSNYVVPQYRPEPSEDVKTSLIDYFETPFVKYEFLGFYHTQFITEIIAKFFQYIVKEKKGNIYYHQIWKNKVIIDLHLEAKKNINYFLLVSFSIEDNKPMLSLSAMNIDFLKISKLSYKEVIVFIEEEYLKKKNLKYKKYIKASDGKYVDFELFINQYPNTKGEITYQFIDDKTKQSYDKLTDFPLFEYLLEKQHKPSKPMLETQPTIYFSYAWGDDRETGESREVIVDQLYESLQQDAYSLRRDKKDLGYKGLISEFMKEIGKGDLIVVVISDKYLKSPYCMFELYESFRRSKLEKEEFVNKIFPIRAEVLDLQRPNVLESYFDYWEKEEKEWENLIVKRGKIITAAQKTQHDMIKEISTQLGNLLNILADMNSLTKELLSEDNFKIIKQEIQNRIKQLG